MLPGAEVTGQLVVRPAEFADYKIIREYDEFLGDRRLDIQRRELLVADYGSARAVGFMKLTASAFLNRPLIEIICVAQKLRRVGIAKSLLQVACQHYVGCHIYLTTEESNEPMKTLLVTQGWALVGHIDGFNFSGERELIYRIGDWV